MRTRLGAFLLAGGAAAAAIGLSATTSLAATQLTWSVSPGGKFTGRQSGKVTIGDTNTKKSLVCLKSTGTGKFESGTGLSGTGIGSVKTLTDTNCTDASGGTYTVTPTGLPWALNATNYFVTKNTVYGTMTGIGFTITGAACTATIAGDTSTTTGTIVIHIHNSPSKLKFEAAGGDLRVYVTSGCTGLFKTGNKITIDNGYGLTPAETITATSS